MRNNEQSCISSHFTGLIKVDTATLPMIGNGKLCKKRKNPKAGGKLIHLIDDLCRFVEKLV